MPAVEEKWITKHSGKGDMWSTIWRLDAYGLGGCREKWEPPRQAVALLKGSLRVPRSVSETMSKDGLPNERVAPRSYLRSPGSIAEAAVSFRRIFRLNSRGRPSIISTAALAPAR